MPKKSHETKACYDPDIKVNDEVYLIDGSALTLITEAEDLHSTTIKEYFIVNSYLELTGSPLNLQAIKGTVTAININNRVTIGYTKAYLQDIIVQIGNAKFRTCSALVSKYERKSFDRFTM